MVSQAARNVVSVRDVDPDATTVTCVLELACGCVVERVVARDRLLELGGELRAVGKYPCPKGHGPSRSGVP